jgi:hypothetical protein
MITLPDTILTRSVVIKMRRRAPSEQIEPYRRRLHVDTGEAIRKRLESWAGAVMKRCTDNFPEMPSGIVDRDADVWEPLLAVADAAGGDWPARSRVAAVALVTDARQSTPSLGIQIDPFAHSDRRHKCLAQALTTRRSSGIAGYKSQRLASLS